MKLRLGPRGIQGGQGPQGPAGWTGNSVVDPSCETKIDLRTYGIYPVDSDGKIPESSIPATKTFSPVIERCGYCRTLHAGGTHCKSCAAPL